MACSGQKRLCGKYVIRTAGAVTQRLHGHYACWGLLKLDKMKPGKAVEKEYSEKMGNDVFTGSKAGMCKV